MKNILTLLLFVVSTNTFAQDWADKISKKFYSTIDSSRKLSCCDKTTNCISVEYEFPTYEMPYNSPEEIFDQHYDEVIDSLTINTIVEDLVKCYNKIPKKFRTKFTKSCFNIDTKTEVSQGYQSELFFAQGKVYFVFSFQMDKPFKRNIFMKLHDMVSGN